MMRSPVCVVGRVPQVFVDVRMTFGNQFSPPAVTVSITCGTGCEPLGRRPLGFDRDGRVLGRSFNLQLPCWHRKFMSFD